MASRCNEKLYHTRLLLDQAAVANGVARQALAEGALFHLVLAYRALLQEIAGATGKTLDLANARQLERELQQEGRRVPGVSELAALEQGGQWPAQMLRAHLEATALQATTAHRQAGGAIALVQLGDAADVAAVESWLMALQENVERQRELSQEW